MEKIIVLMSTYNGEKYLKEQVDSILNQQDVEVTLIIRDDGSIDKTVSILESYANIFPNIEIIKGENIGCKGSFYACAKYAYEKYPDIQFFAFSDQDDVWLPNKLLYAIEKIIINTNSLPSLYFCKPKVVNSKLENLNDKWSGNHLLTFGEACLSQPCAGCCLVYNRRTLELFLKGDPSVMSMHDSWLYKSVLACGGFVVEDPTPHILYRQHGNNVIGTQNFFQRWKRRYQNFVKKSCYRSNQIKCIINTYSDLMPTDLKIKAIKISNYKESGIKGRFEIIRDNEFRTKSPLHNFLFSIAVLLGRY